MPSVKKLLPMLAWALFVPSGAFLFGEYPTISIDYMLSSGGLAAGTTLSVQETKPVTSPCGSYKITTLGLCQVVSGNDRVNGTAFKVSVGKAYRTICTEMNMCSSMLQPFTYVKGTYALFYDVYEKKLAFIQSVQQEDASIYHLNHRLVTCDLATILKTVSHTCNEFERDSCIDMSSSTPIKCQNPTNTFSMTSIKNHTGFQVSLGSSYNPQREVDGKYIMFPFIKSEKQDIVFYDEENLAIWKSDKTLRFSEDEDTINLVRTVRLPQKPSLNHTLGYFNNLLDTFTPLIRSYGLDYDNGINFEGIFGKIGCAVDSIFGGSCSSGGNKKSFQDESAAIEATNNAVRTLGDTIHAVVKEDDSIIKMVNNVKDTESHMFSKFSDEFTKTHKEIDTAMDAANKNLREAIAPIWTVLRVDDWFSKLRTQLDMIEEIDTLVKMSGGTLPSSTVISKLFKGSITLNGLSYNMDDCYKASGLSQASGLNYTAVITLKCSKPINKYSIFTSVPITMSFDGKSYFSTQTKVRNSALALADMRVVDCDVPQEIGSADYTPPEYPNYYVELADRKCIIARSLSFDKQDLSLCKSNEASYICQPHEIQMFPPAYLDEGPLYPLTKSHKTSAVPAGTNLVYPFIRIGGMILLAVPCTVYIPPAINHAMAAGTILSLSSNGGYLNPMPPNYSGTIWSTIQLPYYNNKITRNDTAVYVITKKTNLGKEEKEIDQLITNRTNSLVNDFMKGNDAFQHSVAEFLANKSQEYADDFKEIPAIKQNISELIAKSRAFTEESDSFAQKALKNVEDNVAWYVTAACFLTLANTVGLVVIFVLFFQFKSAHAANATTGDVIDNALETLMPYFISAVISLLIVSSIIKLFKQIICSKARNGFLMFCAIIAIICMSALNLYFINKLYPLNTINDLFSEVFIMAFLYIVFGMSGLLVSFASFCKASPIIPIRSTTPTPCTIEEEDELHTREIVFLAMWITTTIILAITYILIALIKKKGLPDNWVATRYQRLKALSCKMHPVAVKVKRKLNQLTGVKKNTFVTHFVHIGWVSDPDTLVEVSLPSGTLKGVKPCLFTSNGSATKCISINHLMNKNFVVENIDDNVIILVGSDRIEKKVILNFTDHIATKSGRKAYKLVKKNDYSRNAVNEATRNSEESPLQADEPEDEKTYKGTRPAIRVDETAPDKGINHKMYVSLFGFAKQNGVFLSPKYEDFLKDWNTNKIKLRGLDYLL